MHTKDQLAAALRDVGLDEMAAKAATGYYHDFLSPLDLPEIQLMHDLAQAATASPNPDAILALRQRAISGDFDASDEESEQWAASEEGRETFGHLIDKGQ